MRQPTPPKDSNWHTVPPEGKEGIIAHLLSARGLCYKEKNESCQRTWRASYCIEISEVQFDGGGGSEPDVGEKNLQLGSRDYSRMLQRSAAVTGDDGPFWWWVSAAALIGRRSPSPPRSCWPCVGWSGSLLPRACWCLRGETGSRRQRTLCEKTELIAANNPASTTTTQIAQAQ